MIAWGWRISRCHTLGWLDLHYTLISAGGFFPRESKEKGRESFGLQDLCSGPSILVWPWGRYLTSLSPFPLCKAG